MESLGIFLEKHVLGETGTDESSFGILIIGIYIPYEYKLSFFNYEDMYTIF